MQVTTVSIKDQQYRYAVYKNEFHNGWGIFLIGNLQEIESVDFFSTYFSKTLNILVVEIPGTGLTKPLPASFSIQHQASLLKNLINYLKLTEAHILAFSYATPIALEFCLLFKGALSLSMCGGMAGIPEESRLSTMSILADAIKDRKQFAEEFIKGLTVNSDNIPKGKIISRSARQKVHKYSDNQIKCFCENTIRILSYKHSNFSTLKIPCLLFTGELDPYVTQKHALHLAKMLPNCTFKKISNADHLVHLEHPNLTAQLMMETSKKIISYDHLQKSVA